MSRRIKVFFAIAVATIGILSWHWSPARQARLHQAHFLAALENRNWKTVAEFLSPEYRDQWGQTKQELLTHLPPVFQDFLACGILAEERSLERDGMDLVIKSHMRIVGSGGPISQLLISRTETLTGPFALKWRRESWKPWDWALASVGQPQLEIPAELEP